MLVLFPVIALKKMDWLKNGKIVTLLVLFTICANLLPFIPFFWKTNHKQGIDAMRWIAIRGSGGDIVSFQPSELIKITLPLYLAYILDKNRERLNTFLYGPLPPTVITFIFCVLVLRQSNFSEAVFIMLSSMVICFIAGIRLRWFAVALAAIVPVFYALTFGNKEGRWYQRIASFISRAESPPDLKTQIDFSLDAIRSGGFWGKGIGQGSLKIRMPEVHGDFVFASYAEESGFLGVLFYLVLIGIFAWIGYLSAWKNPNRFCMVLTFGLVTTIVIQTLLNIAVVVNFIPTTGIPLPFVSSGGSSLLITLTAAALLVNMTHWNINSDSMGGENVR
jgi:cell division protein FtsW